MILADPELHTTYPEACLRIGDMTADQGHHTHWGSMVDLTSVMHCSVAGGHATADGPVFWINKDGGVAHINHSLQNPHFHDGLNHLMMQLLANAHIGGQPVVHTMLFNVRNPGVPKVEPYPNHSSHLHVNGNPPLRDMRLKDVAQGGGRPEQDLDDLRQAILLEYIAGQGVDGISKGPPIPAPPPAEVAPPPAPAEHPSVPSGPLPLTADELAYLGVPSEYGPYLQASEHFSIADYLAQLKAESNFRAAATSPAGAKGPAQFMPATWRAVGRDGSDPDKVANPRNIEEALDAQRRYMEGQYARAAHLVMTGRAKGDPKDLAWAAYNAGIGRISQYGGQPPFAETRVYVKRIQRLSAEYNAKLLELARNRLIRAAAMTATTTTIAPPASTSTSTSSTTSTSTTISTRRPAVIDPEADTGTIPEAPPARVTSERQPQETSVQLSARGLDEVLKAIEPNADRRATLIRQLPRHQNGKYQVTAERLSLLIRQATNSQE
jgi:hypothetical protein